ncbi:MAG TPA: DNA repair protein RecO [Candidatus Lachnoclostridium stercorigallinarum]|uniref:DNA repair protein RecO n=1 Tax=Candidatus Lachnoclostridium stercorigallinarum TaxID=2838634 RepID=A0A9D2GGV1_9FIRM|nr:DNA repair protein RecO [Candidatus Lachnoclostridium stercorigallinarum]
MRECVVVTGMVLRAAPSGEGDRRLVVLTRERGRITVFARGARRPGSPFLAACRPFSFGKFRLYEGRDAYNLQGAEITAYFEELSADVEGACYGSYFLEVAEYYSRENLDGTDLLMLVYQSLRALLKEVISNELVRRVFELKAMVLNGEYTELPPFSVSDSACYTWEYVVAAPLGKLYTFTVTEEVLEEFGRCVDEAKRRFLPRHFHSLEILKAMTGMEKGSGY